MEPDRITPNGAGGTSLLLAIIFFLAAYIVTFVTFLYLDTGVLFSFVLFDHPQAFAELLAGGLGPFIFPSIHVGIASFFKSKRNSTTRRNIFIGWSTLILIVSGLQLMTSMSQQ